MSIAGLRGAGSLLSNWLAALVCLLTTSLN